MISLAQLIIDRHEAGKSIEKEFAELPSFQMDVRFEDLSPICPSRMALDVERRPGNALNIEIGTPVPRCSQKSPDGRGLTWLRSGGSPLAYGVCAHHDCPRRLS